VLFSVVSLDKRGRDGKNVLHISHCQTSATVPYLGQHMMESRYPRLKLPNW